MVMKERCECVIYIYMYIHTIRHEFDFSVSGYLRVISNLMADLALGRHVQLVRNASVRIDTSM
jgi:hypothetical protein